MMLSHQGNQITRCPIFNANSRNDLSRAKGVVRTAFLHPCDAYASTGDTPRETVLAEFMPTYA